MIDELPEGWHATALANVFEFKYGKALPKEIRNSTGSVRVYGSNGIVGNHDAAVTKGPAIIVGRKGSVGEVHVSPERCWPIDTTYFVDEFPLDLPLDYWGLYLESLRLGLREKSSAIPGISRDDIYSLEVPVPPLAEQKRILARLQILLDKVNACEDRLARISVLLNRVQLAVLASAYSGRLTADWRKQNSNVEKAAILLAKIRKSRLGLATSSKDKSQIEQVFDERHLRHSEGDVGLDGIPNTWLSCRIGAIGAVCNGSTPSRTEKGYWGGDIPWVSSGEVRNNVISETRERITSSGFERSSVRILPKGSVLLAMIGEGKTRGQSAILAIEATINQNVAAVVLEHGLVSSRYLWRWFQLQYASTRQRGGGSGPQALNCQRVRELPFVLPPLAEQREIVRRVEELFAVAKQIETKCGIARASIGKLRPSLLAKAFRGELVLTEAELARQEQRTYESASDFLQRLAQNRVANDGYSPAHRTKRVQQTSRGQAVRSSSTDKFSNRRRA